MMWVEELLVTRPLMRLHERLSNLAVTAGPLMTKMGSLWAAKPLAQLPAKVHQFVSGLTVPEVLLL